MLPWTNWYRWAKEVGDVPAHWEFNHTEAGHVTGDHPQPKSPEFTEQRDWANGTWRYTHVWRFPDGSRPEGNF